MTLVAVIWITRKIFIPVVLLHEESQQHFPRKSCHWKLNHIDDKWSHIIITSTYVKIYCFTSKAEHELLRLSFHAQFADFDRQTSQIMAKYFINTRRVLSCQKMPFKKIFFMNDSTHLCLSSWKKFCCCFDPLRHPRFKLPMLKPKNGLSDGGLKSPR